MDNITEQTCIDLNTNPLGGFNFTELDYPTDYEFHIHLIDIIKILAYTVVFLISLGGNAGVILIACLNAQLRTTVNAYLVNLAVADICIIVFCMWIHLAVNITKPMFVLGAFWCRFNGFAQMTSMTASVLSLTAIACDRFSAVLFPLRARRIRSYARTSALIVFIWLLSAIVSLPLIFYRNLREIQWRDVLETTCQESWPTKWVFDTDTVHCLKQGPDYKRAYYFMVTIALFFAPVLIMSVAYALIIWRLWVSRVTMETDESRVHTQQNAKKKVVKMVLVVLLTFVLCWAPLQILILYGMFSTYTMLPDWFEHVEFWAYFLAYSNSLWNPVLYGGLSNGFSQGFQKMFRCQKPVIRVNAYPMVHVTTTRLRANRSNLATSMTAI